VAVLAILLGSQSSNPQQKSQWRLERGPDPAVLALKLFLTASETDIVLDHFPVLDYQFLVPDHGSARLTVWANGPNVPTLRPMDSTLSMLNQ
jgi:hypothetical protein